MEKMKQTLLLCRKTQPCSSYELWTQLHHNRTKTIVFEVSLAPLYGNVLKSKKLNFLFYLEVLGANVVVYFF